jgi:ADP-ribosyl-[dinitrogen reductase] hydrolase
MLGAIIGDIVGSIYEFNNHKSKEFELFGKGCCFTDDTVHTVAVADWLLNREVNGPGLTDRLVHWSKKYPHCPYGGMFQQWLSGREYEGKYQPYNSYGNGSAMRVSPVAWLSKNHAEDAKKSAEVTHSHPEGIRGAQAVALVIYVARLRVFSPKEIAKEVYSTYNYDVYEKVDKIREWYDFDETCKGTVPQAMSCALQATDFEDAIRNAISIGGDSDSVAAIAGSIAEAIFGIPDNIRDKALTYLPDEMINIVNRVRKQVKPIKATTIDHLRVKIIEGGVRPSLEELKAMEEQVKSHFGTDPIDWPSDDEVVKFLVRHYRGRFG